MARRAAPVTLGCSPAMIYLDNNATTRPCDAAVAAVGECLRSAWANPSSVHREGQNARAAVEQARRAVADLLGVYPREITFTSGGTESIALALRGVVEAWHAGRRGPVTAPPRVVSTLVEHAAVTQTLEQMAKEGRIELKHAPVLPGGLVDLEGLGALLTGETALVSLQWVNNETGAVQPIEAAHALCASRGVPLHCDGVQWVGKEPTAPPATGASGTTRATGASQGAGAHLPCDLLSFSAHKFHGPKGVGGLWVRRGVRLRPPWPGSQELGRRGGTENVPGIVGMGAAALEALAWLADGKKREELASLRDGFEAAVLEGVPGASVNRPAGAGGRIWNTTSIAFPGLEAEAILLSLSERGVCASAGAACSSGSLEPSPVLLAMHIPPRLAHGSVRFSLSRETNPAEVASAVTVVSEVIASLRRTLPVDVSSHGHDG
jgi:cysteine desulfurase